MNKTNLFDEIKNACSGASPPNTGLFCSVADPVHFFGSESADPVIKIGILIRVTQKRPDPTGSGSYLDMIFMLS